VPAAAESELGAKNKPGDATYAGRSSQPRDCKHVGVTSESVRPMTPQAVKTPQPGQSMPSAETLKRLQALLAKHAPVVKTAASNPPAPVVNVLEGLWTTK
jgi:hypothetical protein